MHTKVFADYMKIEVARITYRHESGEWCKAECQYSGAETFVHISHLGSIIKINGFGSFPIIELDDEYKWSDVPLEGTIVRFVPGSGDRGLRAQVWVVNDDYLEAKRRMDDYNRRMTHKLQQLAVTIEKDEWKRLQLSEDHTFNEDMQIIQVTYPDEIELINGHSDFERVFGN